MLISGRTRSGQIPSEHLTRLIHSSSSGEHLQELLRNVRVPESEEPLIYNCSCNSESVHKETSDPEGEDSIRLQVKVHLSGETK